MVVKGTPALACVRVCVCMSAEGNCGPRLTRLSCSSSLSSSAKELSSYTSDNTAHRSDRERVRGKRRREKESMQVKQASKATRRQSEDNYAGLEVNVGPNPGP